MSDQSIGLKGIEVNLSPDAFHMWAQHYFKCKRDFISPHRFSPVPYFLLCRAIELQLKAIHLKTKGQAWVKSEIGHDLEAAYSSLDITDQILSSPEFNELVSASLLYSDKGFEYFKPEHALRGYSNYPNLEMLSAICEKLLLHGTFSIPQPSISSSRLIDFIDGVRRYLTVRDA